MSDQFEENKDFTVKDNMDESKINDSYEDAPIVAEQVAPCDDTEVKNDQNIDIMSEDEVRKDDSSSHEPSITADNSPELDDAQNDDSRSSEPPPVPDSVEMDNVSEVEELETKSDIETSILESVGKDLDTTEKIENSSDDSAQPPLAPSESEIDVSVEGGDGGGKSEESGNGSPGTTEPDVTVISVEEVTESGAIESGDVIPLNDTDEHYPETASVREDVHETSSSGLNLRDSVTMEVHNMTELLAAVPSNPSPPLEKQEEVWSKFPVLESFPDSQDEVPAKKEEPVVAPVADSGLNLLRELVQGSNPGKIHSDDLLSCMLRCHSDVHKAAEVVCNLHKLADSIQITAESKKGVDMTDSSEAKWIHLTAEEDQEHDKQISIDSNEIGITVENVLERTVVHLVKEGSTAQQLGVTAGVLLLAVHNTPTFHLSHFETVDALKRAPRPAKLRFRPLPPPLLVEMRDHMHSLVVQTSAHASIEKQLPKFPDTMKMPVVSDESQILKFTSPPSPPKSLSTESESGHRPAPAPPLVTDWACEQLKLVCQVYAIVLSKKETSDNRQQMLVLDILSNFHESCRRPTRSKNNASHTHKLGSLTQLLNSLVFGLPDTAPRPTHDTTHVSHRQIDWCSEEMKPLLFILADIACALLESDCDTPLMYQMAPPSNPSVFFDASLEPVLNDGAAGALLVIVFRAIFHHEPCSAVQVSTSISASLASTKCERGRVSACRLVLEVYYHTGKFVSEGLLLRGIATRLLVQSQEPSVRAAAVTSIQRLGKFATLNDLDWLNLLCETAASDDDTMVRRGGFEFSLRLLHRLPDLFPSHVISFDGMKDADIDLHLLRCRIVAIVQRLVEDPVPSVRHAVAAHCASLCTLLGGGRMGQQWSTWIVDTLHTFLRDDDAPVRSAAIDAIPFVTLLLRGFAHYYVYHANMHPSADKESKDENTDIAINRVISWNDVAALIRECIAKSGATEVVVQLSVTSMKRTASMLLPALLKLSKEAPEDVRCKVAGAVGQFFVHIQDEVLLLDLGGCGNASNERAEFKKHAWKTLSRDLVCDLVAPLIKAIMKDQCLQVVATLFTELAGLPQSFSWLDAEEGGRGSQPMSSIYLLTQELLSDSRSVLELHDAGANKARHWATAEIVPEELLNSFVVELDEMTAHRDWRNRAVAVRGVLSFASFATTTALQSKLAQICVKMMNDKVHAVRLAAAESMCLTGLIHHDNDQALTSDVTPDTQSDLTPAIGDWCESVVIPQLYDLMQRPVARERQLALYMIQILVSLNIVTRDVTIGVLIPLLLNASQDVVSNVRLSVAKTLYYFMRGNSIKSLEMRSPDTKDTTDDLVGVLAKHSELHRCIERLCADEDMDVNYHARQAKGTLDGFMPTDGTK